MRHRDRLRNSLTAALVAVFAAFLATGCAADRTTAPDASLDANGTWYALGEVPGSSEQWTLTVTGSVVTGNGTWTGEACCGGTVNVIGAAHADSLHLDITYFRTVPVRDSAAYFTEHLDAVLATPSDLVGTFSRAGTLGKVHFAKRTP